MLVTKIIGSVAGVVYGAFKFSCHLHIDD